MGIHLQKVFWHECDSTFVKGKRMPEVTSVCYSSGFGGVGSFLNET